MTEYSRIAKGSFTSTGAAKAIYLPFQPTLVRILNYSSFATPAQHGVPVAWWDVAMGQGYAVEEVFNATPVLTTDIVTSGGISSFAAGLMLQYGSNIQISGITKASPAVVTTASAHGYSSGDVVVFTGLYQSSTTGMPQLCGIPFKITVTAATTFTIPWNTNQSSYTALSASPSGAYVKKVLYPYLYPPQASVISALSQSGSTITVTVCDDHNFVVGQEIAFRIPSSWGSVELNSLPDSAIPGSPIYYYVTSVTGNHTFTITYSSGSITAFATNPTVAAVQAGLTFPQVLAVGDVNSGGVAYSGSTLYPSPVFPTYSGGISSINGPAISGAFVNNTRQGFIIGAGAGTNDSSSVLVGANGNVIYWEAHYTDISSP